MRLIPEADDKVSIRVVKSERDPKTKKIVYTNVETLDVIEAKPEEVIAAIKRAIGGTK